MKMQKATKEEVKFLQGKLEKNESSILFARLADAYLQMDRVDEAIELCERGIKKHPYYVTGHYVLGKCYLRKKLFDQAEKELKRVLLFDPKYIAAHRDYGELMAQIGWNNTCEMSYQEIIRIDPFNEKAKQRLAQLKEQPIQTKEQKLEKKSETELEEIEKSILTESTPLAKKTPEETSAEELIETSDLESGEAKVESGAPPAVKELFKETEDVFEDDKVNLDLLEDIFRDDDLPDLSPGQDFESHLQEDTNDYPAEESAAGDQNYLFGEELSVEAKEQSGVKDLEGLDDDEVFALMAGDEELNKPKMRSPRDLPEPPIRSEQKQKIELAQEKNSEKIPRQSESEFEAPIEKTLEYIQKETKPKFEPPFEETSLESQTEDGIDQTSGEPEIPNAREMQRKKEKIVTSTLGEIYAAQHQYAKAIGVYEILRRKDPDNEFYKQKIDYLQKKLEDSQSEG